MAVILKNDDNGVFADLSHSGNAYYISYCSYSRCSNVYLSGLWRQVTIDLTQPDLVV
jgi:hypothetical protein